MGRKSREKRDRRTGKPQPFKRMDTASAVKACGRDYNQKNVVRTPCKVCDMDVILHCSSCEIQITGCLCSAMERMSPSEFAQFKEEIQRKKAQQSGLWLPGRN